MNAVDLATGKWQALLVDLGIDPVLLDGRNRPCPLCDGRDRFRFLDYRGHGEWVCNQCQPDVTDGMNLAMRFAGESFRQLAKWIEEKHSTLAAAVKTTSDPRPYLRRVGKACRPLVGGGTVLRYLEARGVPAVPMLRQARLVRSDDRREFDCMVALVTAEDGAASTYHVTYLDGAKKADGTARKTLPTVAPPSAIRLHPVSFHLGIAEGIETALAAWKKFHVPTWAAINASLLAKWTPPPEVGEVTIYADNDANYTGQAAAYKCAHRLALLGIKVDVRIPEGVGRDWADNGGST